MDLTRLITTIVGAALTLGAFAWLLRRSGVGSPSAERLVCYGKSARQFILVLTVLVLGFLLAVWLGAFPKLAEGGISSAVAVTLLFVGLILPLWLEFYRVRITWDEHMLYTQSPWRRRRAIPWDDVQDWDYGTLMSWYRIRTGRHGIVRLSIFLSGTAELLDELDRREVG